MNKRLILCITMCLIGLSLVACGKDNTITTIDVSSAATALLDGIKFNDVLTEVDKESLSVLYDIDSADFSDCTIYASTGATAEEIAIFEATDADASKRIKTALEDRVENQKTGFENYVPAEMDKLKHAVIISNSKYVFLCITDSYDTATKIIKDTMK